MKSKEPVENRAADPSSHVRTVRAALARTAAYLDTPAPSFTVRFAVLSGLLLSFYYYPHAPSTLVARASGEYLRAYAAVAGTALRWFEPTIAVHGQDIVGRYSLRVVKTCDAMDVQLLFVSAVISWAARWPHKLLAVALGVTAIFVVNILRICSLYFVGVFSPSSFDFVHIDLWPVVLVITCVAGFLAFVSWVNASERIVRRGDELV
jgi:exosortase/archaeosortase family protein